VGSKESRFEDEIAPGAWINVRIRRDSVKGYDWAVVLSVMRKGRRKPVCLYDNAHGSPERHLYRDGVKLAAEPVSLQGVARYDIPAAIEEVKRRWDGMVERWER
jgi:hypothetical protein